MLGGNQPKSNLPFLFNPSWSKPLVTTPTYAVLIATNNQACHHHKKEVQFSPKEWVSVLVIIVVVTAFPTTSNHTVFPKQTPSTPPHRSTSHQNIPCACRPQGKRYGFSPVPSPPFLTPGRLEEDLLRVLKFPSISNQSDYSMYHNRARAKRHRDNHL